MRVLQLHNRYRREAGEESVVAAEAALLRRAGHEVHEFQVSNPAQPIASAAGMAVSAWNPLSALRAHSFAKDGRFDVAHIHNTWFVLSPSVLFALRRAGIPIVATLHQYRLVGCASGQLLRDGKICELCIGPNQLPGIRYRCYRNSTVQSAVMVSSLAFNRVIGSWTRNVDVFVTMTEFARQKFIQAGLPASRIAVKPHFVPDPGPRSSPPSASGDVLFVGRLGPEKGIEQMVAAWRRLSIPLRLVVIGDGPLRDTLHAQAGPNVHFAGWQSPDEVQAWMLGARGLVFPSLWYESFGLVMVEAMAAGLPVLASALGGTPDLLGPFASELTVSPYDPGAWIDRIETVLGSGARADHTGRALRERYEHHYAPDRGLQLLEEVYARAIATRAER